MKTKFMKWSICLALVLMATACSNNGNMSSLLERIPEDAEMVVVGDVRTVVESAGGKIEGSGFFGSIKQKLGLSGGGSTIELPSYMTDAMADGDANDADDFLDFLKHSGINIEACALAANYDDRQPTIIFALNDEEQFIKAIKDEDYDHEKEKDGVEYYTKTGYESSYGSDISYIAIADGYAYFIAEVWSDSNFKPMKHIDRLISDAKEKSFASTKFADYITEGNAVGMSFRLPKQLRDELRNYGISGKMLDLYKGVACIKSNLDNETATLSVKLFNEDGSEKTCDFMKEFMSLDGTVNTKALDYLGDDEVLVAAGCAKDVNWDKYFDAMLKGSPYVDRATLAFVKAYLEKFDGTFAYGFGVKDGLRSFGRLASNENLVFQEIPFTFVCETRAGKATSVINDVKALLDKQQMTYTSSGNGVKLQLPEGLGEFVLEAKGDMLVLANHKIKNSNNNPTVKALSFDKGTAAMAIVLNKDNELMRQLGLENNALLKATFNYKTCTFDMTFTMDGDSSVGIIGKVAKAIVDLVDRGNELERTISDAAVPKPDYTDWADSVAVDTVAYEEYEDY